MTASTNQISLIHNSVFLLFLYIIATNCSLGICIVFVEICKSLFNHLIFVIHLSINITHISIIFIPLCLRFLFRLDLLFKPSSSLLIFSSTFGVEWIFMKRMSKFTVLRSIV